MRIRSRKPIWRWSSCRENYCRSDSCADELSQFVARKKSLILVELDDFWTNAEDHDMDPGFPPLRRALSGLLSIRFWEHKQGRTLLYGHPVPETASGDSQSGFRREIQRLVDDLKAMAREVPTAAALPRADVDPASGGDATVNIVLAATTSDTKAETDRLAQIYQEAGFAVTRLDRSDILSATAIREALADGQLFVQVIGAIPGRRIPDYENLPSSIAQHRLAKESGISIATWIARDFDLAECGDAYAAFLGSIVTHRSNFEDFEKYSLKRAADQQDALESNVRRQEMKDSFAGANPPLVSIDAAQSDTDLRDRIKDALDEYVHVDCIPINTGMEDLSSAVQDNDAIVLVYGDQPESQKRANSRFRFFRRWKMSVWNADQQRFEIAVGNGAQGSGNPCPSGVGIHVIRIGDDVDKTSMENFLVALGVDRDAAVP